MNFGQMYYLLMGFLAGHIKHIRPHAQLPATGPVAKIDLARANIAHHALTRAEAMADEVVEAFLHQCKRTARNLRLDVTLAGHAVDLRRAVRSLLEVGAYRELEVMTKEALNELTGQTELWRKGEQEALLEELCTRDGRTWITSDFFVQHTSRNASEMYVLVHLPSLKIVGLSAVADFQTPWTAGQFHHMAHACQEDRMFFFGRKSEREIAPKVALDMSASFEGGTRWTSHFHMPTLLAVDIICARRGTAGLAHILLAHILCITSSFTADRTHVLFDISGRENNTRMVKFANSIGATRCQTFTDEARSEGYVGVEGDDPSIYWTYKSPAGHGPNDGNTSGVYALDVEIGNEINTQHPAVLFNDRVTLADFHRGGKNCSYFAVAPLETAQQKLTALLAGLRTRALEDASASADPRAATAVPPQRPWQQKPKGARPF